MRLLPIDDRHCPCFFYGETRSVKYVIRTGSHQSEVRCCNKCAARFGITLDRIIELREQGYSPRLIASHLNFASVEELNRFEQEASYVHNTAS